MQRVGKVHTQSEVSTALLHRHLADSRQALAGVAAALLPFPYNGMCAVLPSVCERVSERGREREGESVTRLATSSVLTAVTIMI